VQCISQCRQTWCTMSALRLGCAPTEHCLHTIDALQQHDGTQYVAWYAWCKGNSIQCCLGKIPAVMYVGGSAVWCNTEGYTYHIPQAYAFSSMWDMLDQGGPLACRCVGGRDGSRLRQAQPVQANPMMLQAYVHCIVQCMPTSSC
jgi:hypothetical protein